MSRCTTGRSKRGGLQLPGATLRRGLAGLPAQVTGRPRVRADAGYFDGGLTRAAVDADADFAIAAKRNPAMWAYHGIPAAAWRPAQDMHNTEVAASDYAPAGWPPGSYTIVRQVRIPPRRSPPTLGPGGGAPPPTSSSRSPCTAGSTRSTRSASSSPTCLPTTTAA